MTLNYTAEQLLAETRSRGEDKDCAVRAVTAALDYSYDDVHWTFKLYGRKDRHCTPVHITMKVIDKLGYYVENWTNLYRDCPTIRTFQRKANPNLTYLVFVRKHVLCVRGGQALDWANNRCHRIQSIFVVREKPSQAEER